MADIGKIEYSVRKVTRYYVTRYYETSDARAAGSEPKGEYDNEEVAHEVAYALCKAEHDRLGFPAGDERIQYPKREDQFAGRFNVTGSLTGYGASAR